MSHTVKMVVLFAVVGGAAVAVYKFAAPKIGS